MWEEKNEIIGGEPNPAAQPSVHSGKRAESYATYPENFAVALRHLYLTTG